VELLSEGLHRSRLSRLNFWAKVCLPENFLRSRAARPRPKSEKPRRSREGKRGKRLKRQQQECKEKYRSRQCRANHEQQHQLSKLRATHDVQQQRSGARNFSRWGLPHAPNPTPRKGVTAIVLRIRLGRYCGISSKNNSACPILFGFPLDRRSRRIFALDPVARAAGARRAPRRPCTH
jgi:hypothetical protein